MIKLYYYPSTISRGKIAIMKNLFDRKFRKITAYETIVIVKNHKNYDIILRPSRHTILKV